MKQIKYLYLNNNINFLLISQVDAGKWYQLKLSNTPSSSSTRPQSQYVFPGEGWKSFPSLDIPNMFNYGHIYHYLIESISNFGSSKDMDSSNDEDGDCAYTSTAKPLRKGTQLMKSNFISDIEDCSTETNYFLRAHVYHSMKKDNALNVQIGLSKISGSVTQAACNCKASALARCAHISALLLKFP